MAVKKSIQNGTAQATSQTYTVTGKMTVDIALDITAASLSEAVTKATAFKLGHYLSAEGEVIDNSEPEIIGVYKN